jgi:hypothetical protein
MGPPACLMHRLDSRSPPSRYAYLLQTLGEAIEAIDSSSPAQGCTRRCHIAAVVLAYPCANAPRVHFLQPLSVSLRQRYVLTIACCSNVKTEPMSQQQAEVLDLRKVRDQHRSENGAKCVDPKHSPGVSTAGTAAIVLLPP